MLKVSSLVPAAFAMSYCSLSFSISALNRAYSCSYLNCSILSYSSFSYSSILSCSSFICSASSRILLSSKSRILPLSCISLSIFHWFISFWNWVSRASFISILRFYNSLGFTLTYWLYFCLMKTLVVSDLFLFLTAFLMDEGKYAAPDKFVELASSFLIGSSLRAS